VRDAARILAEANFHALPVVDGENLVGIVTSTDLLKFLADL
jgi:CBS domain-containing protein